MGENFPGYVMLDEYDPQPATFRDTSPPKAFPLERWNEITFEAKEEWLIKRMLPRRGLGAIYGKPGSLKSFVAVHIGLCVALGRDWAGRRVSKASVVYIGAEGAAGLRKRKAGYVKAWADLPANVDFALISAAPNLGADPGDLPALITAIERAGIKPGLIIIDTVAKAIGAGDENGSGMTAFVGNAGALAQRLDCLVLAVHHVGLGDEAQKRMRGHSSFHGALDAQLLCEKDEGGMSATLTLQKLKDDASDIRLTANMSRVVVDQDEDGEDASTLIVDDVTDAGAPTSTPRAKTVPASQRLLMSAVSDTIGERGEELQPFGAAGIRVRAVAERTIRSLYFARVADRADDGEDPEKLLDRQRNGFKRAIKSALDAQSLVAADFRGERFIWLP